MSELTLLLIPAVLTAVPILLICIRRRRGAAINATSSNAAISPYASALTTNRKRLSAAVKLDSRIHHTRSLTVRADDISPPSPSTAAPSGVLYIHILEAQLIQPVTSFVTVTFGTDVHRTVTVKPSLYPYYAQKCRLVITPRSGGSGRAIQISLYKQNNPNTADCIARTHINPHKMTRSTAVRNEWIKMAAETSHRVVDVDDADDVEQTPLIANGPTATPLPALHIETLFVPIRRNGGVGRKMITQLVGIGEGTLEGTVDEDNAKQLIASFDMDESRKAEMIQAIDSHKRVIDANTLIRHLVAADAPSEVDVVDTRVTSAEASEAFSVVVESSGQAPHLSFRRCPVCLTPFAAPSPPPSPPSPSRPPDELDDFNFNAAVHVRFCIDNIRAMSDTAERSEFCSSGYLSEEFAVKGHTWDVVRDAISSSPQPHSDSNDSKLLTYLSSHPADFILIIDRRTGQLKGEKIPFLLHLWFRYMYAQHYGPFALQFNLGLMHQLTHLMGSKYNLTQSAKLIGPFVRYYDIDMTQFNPNDISQYSTFNSFFYRPLAPGCRPVTAPLDESIIVSPADCRLTVFDSVGEATRIWIKGKTFSLSTLLNDDQLIQQWPDCSLALCRLAPDDYHRFHSPVDGVVGIAKTAGAKYDSVNPIAIRSHKDVLTQNKRTLMPIRTNNIGDVLFIAVGAAMVGSVIITVPADATVAKGDELGRFAYGGSTVLLLFQKAKVRFDADLVNNTRRSIETYVRVGERIAQVRSVSGLLRSRSENRVVSAAPADSTVNPLTSHSFAADATTVRNNDVEVELTVDDLLDNTTEAIQQIIMNTNS